jgi:hypothetical protein
MARAEWSGSVTFSPFGPRHSPRAILRYSVFAVLAGCAGTPPPGPGGLPAETAANIGALMRLDVNGDGLLDRAEVDSGLQREYAAADTNRDGRLSADETGDENARRWRADGPAATPLIDWNQDGTVDFVEFANATRGLFDMADSDHNGALSADELVVARRGPPGPRREQGPPARTP